MGGTADAGFARALEPRPFLFPADHAAHPEFKHEWWYFTGNLNDAEGRRFGYQVTLFRIALSPLSRSAPEPERSRWATRQVWMAHAAITDGQAGEHRAKERLVRDALGLAGALAQPLVIWVEDWTLQRDATAKTWRIDIEADDFALQLKLAELREPIPQGDRGLSQKGAQAGNASYYYSIPRLQTRGNLRIGDKRVELSGLSWLDREWSTSALDSNQAGWDWFSLQLQDGADLMYYQLRRKDGGADPNSRGLHIAANGARTELNARSLQLKPLDWWQDPEGKRYPIAWEMRLNDLGQRWRIQALIPDQLMDLSVRYWEGAVDVIDLESKALLGRGYLEMAGY
jgi:predicted secreted hydrolase